jgi:hypothetical protein
MEGKEGEGNPALKALMADPKFQGFVGENVGQQYYDPKRPIDINKFAQAFLDLWLQDEDQKRNLMFYAFNRIGIGMASDGKAIFVSVIFATDLGLPPPPDEPDDKDATAAAPAPPTLDPKPEMGVQPSTRPAAE